MTERTIMLVDFIKSKVIISEIQKQDPEKLAIQVADIIDRALDDSFGGPGRSQNIQDTLIPFINKFAEALTKRLSEN
jgi:hypothetical protein